MCNLDSLEEFFHYVYNLDSPEKHGDVWKPPNQRHESYSLLLESLLQARHEVSAFVQACKDVG